MTMCVCVYLIYVARLVVIVVVVIIIHNTDTISECIQLFISFNVPINSDSWAAKQK